MWSPQLWQSDKLGRSLVFFRSGKSNGAAAAGAEEEEPCLSLGSARSRLRGDSVGSEIIVCGGGELGDDRDSRV